jgi:transmembrane sensor
MAVTDAVLRNAIDWHVRQNDLDAAGWEAFVTWLEADQAHSQAYERIAMGDALATPALTDATPVARPVAANDEAPRRWRAPIAIGGAMAAALVAAVTLLPPAMRPAATPPVPVIAGGTPVTRILADGTRVEVAPASRVEIAANGGRTATLTSGTAVFSVRHNPEAPFELKIGNHIVRDVGTVFEASLRHGRIVIAVSEGAVMIDPDSNAIMVPAGRQLLIDPANNSAHVSAVAAADVGAWRSGRLDFADQPLSTAVDALSRATGAEIGLAGQLQGRRFTGMVRLSGDASQDIPRFAALTGTVAKRDGSKWVIAPAGGKP